VVAECVLPGPKEINPRSAFLKFSKTNELKKRLSETLPSDGFIDLGTIQLDSVTSERFA
jgi:hypothetical protein